MKNSSLEKTLIPISPCIFFYELTLMLYLMTTLVY